MIFYGPTVPEINYSILFYSIQHNVYYCVSHQRCSSTIISYTTIGYMYSFVHEKSKEGDLYLVDNVENGIILSPEGPNFEGRPREN